jgi:tRNA/rRNA methyltransferase
MKNFGFHHLRVVEPLCTINAPAARAMSAGATDILEQASVYSSLSEALSPFTHIFATSAESRDMVQSYTTPKSAAQSIQTLSTEGANIALMFGPERTGLNNEDLTYAHHIISIPVNPDFSSLNLAQALLVVCYEIYEKMGETRFLGVRLGETQWAEEEEFQSFLDFFKEKLTETNFWKEPRKETVMWRNIRNIFRRQNITKQDLRTLRGIFVRFLNHK